MYFQDLILALQNYWNGHGCLLTQPYDIETGAGTFNPATFLRALGPEPFNAAYVEPCRRPADGRYGENPIRLQHYFQFQVVMKPNPDDIVERYLGSLAAIGITPEEHDIRFVHDDWESPTLGAWGLGWEVWADGMEITQFTYFQQVGGFELHPVMGEITYGLERICMFLQKVDNVYDLAYNEQFSYGDIYHQNEVRFSEHNFKLADVQLHLDLFQRYENECNRLCEAGNPHSALDYCLKASHTFNLLDARGAVSVNERQGYILRVRQLARQVSEAWITDREQLGFPLVAKSPAATNEETAHPLSEPEISDEQLPLLIEIGVEEMPAQVFKPLLAQLPALAAKRFEEAQLAPEDLRCFVTPRRIVLSIANIATRQADIDEARKGPPLRVARDDNGDWTKAAKGFAARNGITLEEAEIREIKGVDYLFARVREKGQTTAAVLGDMLPKLLSDIHWYKVMRWGSGKTAFVRPVKWLTVVLGDHAIPVSFGGVHSSNVSYGHRFLAPEPVAVTADRASYLATLRDRHVIADHVERQGKIRDLLNDVAQKHDCRWREDEALLAEVTHLVEFPFVIRGTFAEEYLKVPEMVLVSEMRVHQKYFAFEDNSGRLDNSFVTMANMRCTDPDVVQSGNEKVLRSRFADAQFFLHEDTQSKLRDRGEQLNGIIFQAKLGTIGDKITRMEAVTQWLGDTLALNTDQKSRIADINALCKTDLTTEMVGEFPDLQGEIGTYYATLEGYDNVTAQGIRDHYRPRSVTDSFPTSLEAAIVGVADRIDSLVGIFAIGKKPTGSADPFALRRACLTSILLIVKNGLRVDLGDLIQASIESYGNRLDADTLAETKQQLLEFYHGRIPGLFQEIDRDDIPGPFSRDSVAAVLQAKRSWHDLADLVRRFEAMEAFRGRDDFDSVAATFKRSNNILKDGQESGELDATLLQIAEERQLLEAVEKSTEIITAHLNDADYVGALAAVAPLHEPVNVFFDAVRVNDPDEALRRNRRLLVQKVAGLVTQVADFTAIQGA